MCFVSVCLVVAGMPYGMKKFVLFVAFWLGKRQLKTAIGSPSRTSHPQDNLKHWDLLRIFWKEEPPR